MFKKHSILSLALCVCLGLAMPAFAAVTVEFMPSEVIAALVADQMQIKADVTERNNISTTSYVLREIALPTSLDIETPNINVSKIHQTYPMTNDQKHFLQEQGYSDTEIAAMDMGDFMNIENACKIDAQLINSVKYVYRELENVDISDWTYGKLKEYAKNADNKKYLPTPEQEKQFNERGITLSDARTLLKDYYSYDNILAQSDEKLAKEIEQYYQFNISNIIEMARFENPSDAQIQITPSTNPNSAFYVKAYFNGYGEDWFHKDSGTATYAYMIEQAAAAQAAYECLYGTSINFTATNLYGTWSATSSGAHEGIDFTEPSGGNTCDIYSIAEGTVIATGGTLGRLSIYTKQTANSTSDVNKTFSYLHMSSVTPSKGSAVNTNDKAGKQGDVGAEGAYHVHFQVENGNTTTLHSARNDNNLESLSPYQLRPFLSY